MSNQQSKHRDYGEGSIYQRKDGRWVASIRLPNGKRLSRYGATKQEAREKLKKAQREQEQGKLITAKDQLLRDHMGQWLEVKKLDLKAGTYCYYRDYINDHIIPVLGHIKLQTLTVAPIQKMYTNLLESGMSPNTVRMIHSILKGALDAAVRWKKISHNPSRDVTPPRKAKKELQYLTIEQAQKLLATAKGHRLECLLILAVTTGMRRGEILALHWSDINFEQGFLQVNRSLSYRNPDGAGHKFEEVEPKTHSSKRAVTLPDFVLVALKEQKIKLSEERLHAPRWEDKNLVFPSTIGGYFHYKSLQEEFKALLRDAELPNIRFHDLRHSAATILLAMGVNPKVIQELLGHSHISITLGVYGHVTQLMQQEAMSKLDGLFRRQE